MREFTPGEGVSHVGEFDFTDTPDEAELAAQKAEEAKKKKPEVAGVMAKIKERLNRGSEPKIKTTRDITELSDAGIKLEQDKLDEARKKIQLADGTGEVPLSEKDMLDVENQN